MRDRRRTNAVFLIPSQGSEEAVWKPAVDIYKLPNGWLLKFDLAGVRTDDVVVRFSGCRVTVKGVRRDFLLEQGYQYYSMEISYSRFERTIELPCELGNTEHQIERLDGYLLIRITTGTEEEQR